MREPSGFNLHFFYSLSFSPSTISIYLCFLGLSIVLNFSLATVIFDFSRGQFLTILLPQSTSHSYGSYYITKLVHLLVSHFIIWRRFNISGFEC